MRFVRQLFLVVIIAAIAGAVLALVWRAMHPHKNSPEAARPRAEYREETPKEGGSNTIARVAARVVVSRSRVRSASGYWMGRERCSS